MQVNNIRRALLEGVQPVGLCELRAARDYARSQRLSCGPVSQLIGYRRAKGYGLHLLPPEIGLDGLVVDVGANRGDFTAVVRQLEPRSRALCLEPIPGNAAHLRQRFATDPRVDVHAVAASDHTGSAMLNITDATEFASLHEPGEGLVAYGPAAAVVDQARVSVAALDDLVTSDVRVLKIDVQGHEAAVLRGADRTLARTSVVLIEVMFTSQYEGAAMFAELHDAMCAAEFYLVGLHAPSQAPAPLLWGDACYVRGTP